VIVGTALVPTIIAGKIIGGGIIPGGGIIGGGTTPEEGINTSDESTELDSEEGTPGAPGVDAPEEPPEEPPEEDPYVPPSGGSGNPSAPEDESPEEDPQEDLEGMAPSIDEDIIVLNIQSKTEGTSSPKVESIALSVDEVVSGIVVKTFLPK